MLKIFIIVIFVFLLVKLLFDIFKYCTNKKKKQKQNHEQITNNNIADYYMNLLDKNDININEKFSNIPIYVINLARSKERFNNIKEQETKYGIKINFIEAVDGNNIKNINSGQFDNINYINNGFLSKYELACALSHLKAIKTAYDNNDEYSLILEDDVSFSLVPLWDTTLLKIIDNAPKDWEFISLYSLNKCSENKLYEYKDYYNYNCWGMASYLLNRKGMEAVINKLYNKSTNSFFLDKNLSRLRNSTTSDGLIPVLLKSYFTKQLFFCINNKDEMDSTIHKEHTSQHINMSNYTLRKYYDDFNFEKKIPKILHLIWIGKNPQPKTITSWTVDFAKYYPYWEVKVWNDNDIEKLNLVNKKYYDMITEMCGKADLARYEILYRYGGMYIDADSIWLGKPFNENFFKGLLNMSYEKKNLIMNTWFASIKNHPFFKLVIDSVKFRNLKESPWLCVGPTLITDVYNSLNKEIEIKSQDINFVEFSELLCPSTWHGINKNNYDELLNQCKNSDVFAFHWGLSTNNNQITNSDDSIYFPVENVTIEGDKTLSPQYFNYLKNYTEKESKFRNLFLNLLKSGDIKKNIIDCGAYIGDNSLVWAKMQNNIIYAFEPSLKKCNFIKDMCTLNNIKNIKIINYGLSDKNETINISDNSENVNYIVGKNSGKIQENFTTLDELYSKKIIENVDFFHLDVEGFEDKALNGSKKILSELRPILTVEIHPHYIELGDSVEVLKIIDSFKYNCYIIPECCGDVSTCRNILCVPVERKLNYSIDDFQKVNYLNINDLVKK